MGKKNDTSKLVCVYCLVPACDYGNHVWDKALGTTQRKCVRCGLTITISGGIRENDGQETNNNRNAKKRI